MNRNLGTFVAVVTMFFGTSAFAQAAKGEVKDSTSKVELRGVTLTTITGQATASLAAKGIVAEVGGGKVEIGNIDACNGRIQNVHVDVKADALAVVATGPIRIGNVSAGCKP